MTDPHRHDPQRQDSQGQNELSLVVQRLQMVVGTLIAGCVIFLVIVLVIPSGEAPRPDPPMMTYIAVGFAVAGLFARAIVPGIMAAALRRKILQGTWPPPQGQGRFAAVAEFLERTGERGSLAMLFNMRTIVAAAILESAIFFLLCAYLIEHRPGSLVVAVLLLLGLFVHIPTHRQLADWIEDQLRLLEEERQLGG